MDGTLGTFGTLDLHVSYLGTLEQFLRAERSWEY